MRAPVADVAEEGDSTDQHSNSLSNKTATMVVAIFKTTDHLEAARMVVVETVVLFEEAISPLYQLIARKDSTSS